MRPTLKGEYYDSGFLLSAVFVWMLSALAFLIISSIILNETGCSEKSIGYVSSLVSFLSALAAGITAAKKRKAGTLYTALLTATVLVTALLTVGFLINGSNIEPSAVMSVISFTFAGSMVGSIFFFRPGNKRKRYKPQI